MTELDVMPAPSTLNESSLSLSRVFADRYKLLLILLSVSTTGFFLWLTAQYGAGYLSDSAVYLSVSAHLLGGQGLVMYDGARLILWPPFYPIVLAAAALVSGSDPFAAAPVVNAVLYGGTVYLAGVLFVRHLKSPWLALAGTLAVMLREALVYVFIMALTDGMYCLLVVAYILCFELYKSTTRRNWIVLAGVVVALACLSRYAALIMIPIGVASIVLFCRGTIRTKLAPILVFAAVSSVPILIWMACTYRVAGSLFGGRGTPLYTLPQALATLFNTLRRWYVPSGMTTNWLWIALAVLTLGLIVVLVRNHRTELRALWANEGDILFFVVVYLAFLVYSGITSFVSPLDDRLLSPIFAPLTLLLLVGIEKIVDGIPMRYLRLGVGVAVAIALGIFLVNAAQVSYSRVRMYLAHQWYGLNNPTWLDSTTIRYASEHAAEMNGCEWYSNAPEPLYTVARIEAQRLPNKSMLPYIQNKVARGLFPKADTMCLVSLNGIHRPELMGVQELAPMLHVQLVGEFSDGTIYLVSKNGQ